jgi:hypothetical protein
LSKVNRTNCITENLNEIESLHHRENLNQIGLIELSTKRNAARQEPALGNNKCASPPQPITRGEAPGATNRSGKFDELYFLGLGSGEKQAFIACGYPDEVEIYV